MGKRGLARGESQCSHMDTDSVCFFYSNPCTHWVFSFFYIGLWYTVINQTMVQNILAAKDIKKGEVFSEENLILKTPGNRISPMKWHDIIGKVAKRDFIEDELIEI